MDGRISATYVLVQERMSAGRGSLFTITALLHARQRIRISSLDSVRNPNKRNLPSSAVYCYLI